MLVVAGLLAVGLVIVAAWMEHYFDRLDERCPWYDDEGTMAAPRSLQGRVVCDDSGVSDVLWFVVLGSVALLLLAALALWLCRHTVLTVVVVLLAVLVPVGIAETALRLDDTCSAAQWDTYGKEGCERNRELR